MRRFHDGRTLLWCLSVLKFLVASTCLFLYFFVDSELVVDHEHWSHILVFLLQTLLLYSTVKGFYYSVRLAMITLFPPSKILHLHLLIYLLCIMTSLLGVLYRNDIPIDVKHLELWMGIAAVFFIVKTVECFVRKWQIARFEGYLCVQNVYANTEITHEFVRLNYHFLFANRAFARNFSTLGPTLIYEYVRLRRYANLLQKIGSNSTMPTKLMIHNDLLGEITNHINFLLLKDRQAARRACKVTSSRSDSSPYTARRLTV